MFHCMRIAALVLVLLDCGDVHATGRDIFVADAKSVVDSSRPLPVDDVRAAAQSVGDAPMGDPPAAVIAIGSGSPTSAQLSRDGKRAGVLVFEQTARVDKAIAKVAWLGIAATFVIFWLIGCHRAWRRRGRTLGIPYCRGCGYRLTGSATAKCPECGLLLTAKTTQVSTHSPLVASGRSFILLALLTGLLCWQSATIARSIEALLPRWDSVEVARWVDEHEEWRPLFVHDRVWRVDIYDLERGSLERSVELRAGENDVDLVIGPQLKYVFGTATSRRGRQTTLVKWSVFTGAMEMTTPIGEPAMEAEPAHFTRDHARVIRVADDERFVLISTPQYRLIDTEKGGVEVGAWHDPLLRVPGYICRSESKGEQLIEDMRTESPVSRLPDSVHWMRICGIDPLAQRLMVEARDHIAIYDFDSGGHLFNIPKPLAGVKDSFRESTICAPIACFARYWAIVEQESGGWSGRFDPGGRCAIGLWNVDQQRYVARFDGPWTVEGLATSSDGQIGAILDPRGKRLWVYDFDR